MEPGRTAISDSDDTHVWIRGHDLASLMTGATFGDVVFLLHTGGLPSAAQRRVMDAILIAIAVSLLQRAGIDGHRAEGITTEPLATRV